MILPAAHPQRHELNDEVHARPPERLQPPTRLSYLALLAGAELGQRERQYVAALAARYGAPAPAAGARHYSHDLGPFRLKWERHTEFVRYKFIVRGVAADDPFGSPALDAVPGDWLAGLDGQLLVAVHTALQPAGPEPIDHEAISQRWFGGNTLVGSAIASGMATALTDFRIQSNGFGRLLVLDRGLTANQAGRMIQRLLELETYRMMALLAWPLARQLMPELAGAERELSAITTALADAGQADEPILLDRLTRLEAQVSRREADHDYRFAASAAYFQLVERRIVELREERIKGLQTFAEFTGRRLGPAMTTCRAVSGRQHALSERVARTTQLLSTRVDVTLERQNQAVLESMNRRAQLQLRLQQTVEGLSVAAITYYIVSLVSYAAKAFKSLGAPLDADLLTGVSIPIVLVLVAVGVRRLKQVITRRPVRRA